ncbi:LemA family protein [Fructilactobacillus myrtifloralis]|uniref:LemA family protein n=1 Tax=Fructilactobacillus myrtifloralis TaxID=2940301 RepID=A0ABY5BMU5_9LACO|nr:LemA family protein [Fructilactobacillus myrtifloralis]USS84814.1 LemA family protein [Fructilactobacillus myrtifloralis]
MKLKKGYIITGVIALIIVVLGGWLIGTSNGFVRGQQQINQDQGNLEVQLKRRADLTPQLVSTLKGSMKNEQKIFGDIAASRNQYANAKTLQDKNQAVQNMDKQTNVLLNAVQENYPNLASSNQVSELMTQIEGSENRVSQARRTYNQDVTEYNTQISVFPGDLIAHFKGLKPYPTFKADANAQAAPKIDLNTDK